MTEDMMHHEPTSAATLLRESASDMRRAAAAKEQQADEYAAGAAKLRARADALRMYANQYDDAANELAPLAFDGSAGQVVRFKTVGSLYEVDEVAKTWARVPHVHGPSGYLPTNVGKFVSHTPVAVGVRVVFHDPEMGTFHTSAVQEVLA